MKATQGAIAAVKAAKNEHNWGTFAALRFAVRNGATLGMFDKARQVECNARIRNALRGYLA